MSSLEPIKVCDNEEDAVLGTRSDEKRGCNDKNDR